MVPKDTNTRGDDLRQAPRNPMIRFVWYRVLVEDGPAAEGVARSCDVSNSGIGIQTTREIPPGATLFVEIAAQDFNLSAVGRVVHCAARGDTYRVGIAFVVIPPNDRPLLRKLCETKE